MDCSVRRSLALSFLAVLAPVLFAPTLEAQSVPRRPRGIYAVVNVEGAISQQQKANASVTTAQLDAYFDTLYQSLLADPAIAGLALQEHWDTVNPNPPGAANAYLWNYVDDAFAQALAWNSQNSSAAPKTIQLIVTPGFNSPQWMLNELTSCDGLFATPVQTPPSTCGKATFLGYQEGGDGTELPLPWNPLYKSAWQTFVTALAARYGSNPAFVSIAVAGPTAASAEMLVPTDANANNPQTQFGASITPSHMWLQLLALQYPTSPAYQNSNQAFIAEWENAIDLFGQIFNGITLVATTGNGLPNFAGAPATPPPAFTADCPTLDPDCAAETTILAYFAEPAVGGANAKASQNSGMEASRSGINLGVPGVKQLSASTAQFTSPSSQILGGAQFNTSFSNDPVGEGCDDTFPPNTEDMPAGCIMPATCTTNGCIPVDCIPQACLAPGVTSASLAMYQTFSKVPSTLLISPEQAAYNVLNFYFSGTAGASSFGATQGATPLNYLQVYSPDIQYAEMNVDAPAQVVQTGGSSVSMSAQELLDLASPQLLAIAEPSVTLAPAPAVTPGSIGPTLSTTGMIEPGEWISIYGTNIASAPTTWTGNFPTSLAGVSVAIDGNAAYLSYVSPTQIDLQVPNDSTTGVVPVVVTTPSGVASSTATLSQFGPSFFLLDSKHAAGIIIRTNGSGAYGGGTYDILGPTGTSLGYKTIAAKAGDVVELFGTGFGPTSPPVLSGQLFSGAAGATNSVTLRIGNTSVTPSFAGLSGPGLYQFNLTIPSGLGSGDVSLQSTVAGVQTPAGVAISLQ
jgi:uncharacterized protein (TIGR03437 family)